jgi:hypothetical protein
MIECRIMIGPARNGRLLELGVVRRAGEDDVTVVHAMPARPIWKGRSTRWAPLPPGIDGNLPDDDALADWFESTLAPEWLLG